MPKICYVEKNFSSGSMGLIDKANEIIDEYEIQGYELTLRQLYYQMVARDIIANKQTEYKRLGSIVNDARLAGLIDWDRISDLTRELRGRPHWGDPSEIVSACARQFNLDLWRDQKYRPEVWVEKDALRNVIERACDPWDVPYFSCRGYTSQSEMWGAAMRMKRYIKAGQRPVIIHLGDHDPSGIDMTRDIKDRLELFVGEAVDVRRIALNMDQIDQYNPPPNPAKTTDARAKSYIELHGDESWELDALDPATINNLISREIESVISKQAFREAKADQASCRDELQVVADNWTSVAEYATEKFGE